MKQPQINQLQLTGVVLVIITVITGLIIGLAHLMVSL